MRFGTAALRREEATTCDSQHHGYYFANSIYRQSPPHAAIIALTRTWRASARLLAVSRRAHRHAHAAPRCRYHDAGRSRPPSSTPRADIRRRARNSEMSCHLCARGRRVAGDDTGEKVMRCRVCARRRRHFTPASIYAESAMLRDDAADIFRSYAVERAATAVERRQLSRSRRQQRHCRRRAHRRRACRFNSVLSPTTGRRRV